MEAIRPRVRGFPCTLLIALATMSVITSKCQRLSYLPLKVVIGSVSEVRYLPGNVIG